MTTTDRDRWGFSELSYTMWMHIDGCKVDIDAVYFKDGQPYDCHIVGVYDKVAKEYLGKKQMKRFIARHITKIQEWLPEAFKNSLMNEDPQLYNQVWRPL